MKERDEIERQAKVFGALSDPTRLRIVELLAHSDKKLSGSDIVERLGISFSLLCHHGHILLDAGIIEKEKQGQTTNNWLNRKAINEVIRTLL